MNLEKKSYNGGKTQIRMYNYMLGKRYVYSHNFSSTFSYSLANV